jgi:hypothetical protein
MTDLRISGTELSDICHGVCYTRWVRGSYGGHYEEQHIASIFRNAEEHKHQTSGSRGKNIDSYETSDYLIWNCV